MTNTAQPTGLLAWFASNSVAANLLMMLIFIGGIIGFNIVDKEVFPRFSLQKITITAAYPNASPEDIETSLCSKIENAIYERDGVTRLKTEITEGLCLINVSILPNVDQEQMINALRAGIQSIPRLPKGIENISVQAATRDDDSGVIWVALHGETAALALQRYGEPVKADIERIDGVRLVRNYNEIPYEITIEVSAAKLRQYHTSLHDVTDAIHHTSLNQSAGLIKTPAGELSLRVQAKVSDVESLSNIVLRTDANGAKLRLSQVAVIRDGLEERLSEWHHNGETAQGWEIHTKHSSVDVARNVKRYVADMQTKLPQGLTMTTWWDTSQAYDERVQTLIEDGLSGFVLVCLVLTLFLRLRVAVWAGVGIFTSIFGALWLMPVFDVSLNMLSLFGFLLAMGILVDDAIIIGESVYSLQEQGTDSNLNAAIKGVQAVALPVILSVLVSLVAFLPSLFLPSWAGRMMRPICLVMILTLVFSLIEALLILPSHLAAESRSPKRVLGFIGTIRVWLNQGLDRFVNGYYRPFLQLALRWRYLTIACFMVLLLLCTAWVESGRSRLSLQADVTKDSFWVSLKTPEDLPYSETRKRAKQVEQAFFELRDELNASTPNSPSVVVGLETMIFEHSAGFWTEFSPEGRQRLVVEDFINDWRKRVGDLGRTKIDFLYKEGDVDYDLEFDLGATDPALLAKAAEQFKANLASYNGVFDVIDSAETGKPEIRLSLKPNAEHLGLRLEQLSEQVNHAYYGDEVERLQRGRNEVKIRVRIPRVERESLDNLRNLPIRLPDGQLVPLGIVAEVSLTNGLSKIIRQDRRRVLKIQARVDRKKVDVNALYDKLENNELKTLQQRYAGLSIDIGQSHQDQKAMSTALQQNTLISLLVIYVLIAVPFRSYLKPLIFLLAAPVAWCGAVIAHALVGLPLSMESLVGMVAASGVVVNDSLVLLDYLREHQDDDAPIAELICAACTSRFRAIFLAFLTNFAGFLPTLLETSPQAQFLIPMTLSLSAGLLLGMTASLILTPVCYAVLGK
ncbi:MAG: efflux RND transporter permease subunit [Methylococcales bacterium]|nr:efflux RND transporter permease subunit [Methylococcales bacterium]